MKVGFIGAGNMASAMIGGMLQKGLLQKEDSRPGGAGVWHPHNAG